MYLVLKLFLIFDQSEHCSSYKVVLIQKACNWLAAGQINLEIAQWVVDSKVKQGKAFATIIYS